MGSEQKEGTSLSPAETTLCANGCGFFGTAANMNLCSKCYRDIRVAEEQAASAKAAVEKSFNPSPKLLKDAIESAVAGAGCSRKLAVVDESMAPPPPRVANRCFSCNKKVGLTGFVCKCDNTFCGTHRYAEKHQCTFDFKGSGREKIAKLNPVVKADKVEKI